MKILWITNNILPEAQQLLSGSCSYSTSGGWLLGAAEMLLQQPNVELFVASLSENTQEMKRLQGEKIVYYLLPFGKGNARRNKEYEPYWKKVQEDVRPDVVHIHGTEFSHGLAYINACGSHDVCVSIQGMPSVIKEYFHKGLSNRDILKSTTLGTVLYGGIFKSQRLLKSRAESEVELIKKVKYVIGRTTWDRAHTWSINPQAEYFYGGETLRRDFYQGDVWQYEKCSPCTIFVSQAGSPLKGLHMLLRALPLVLQHYPETKVRIAGSSISDCSNIKRRLLIGDYGNYIRKYLNKHGLAQVVSFTGPLDGNGMKKEYLNSNVFICPSSIENSPNSLAEAQILGVPVIGSYVGGIPDMMLGDETYMYRYEDTVMLAYLICQLFAKKGQIDMSLMRDQAIMRHDPKKNVETLINIYKIIHNE